MVRFKGYAFCWVDGIPPRFHPTMVRFKEALAGGTAPPAERFHPTMVRFKGPDGTIYLRDMIRFPSHYGAI